MTTHIFEPDESLLVPIRVAGTKPPLFCCPGTGGGAIIFREMAGSLDSDQPVYAIAIEKLYERLPKFTIKDLAQACLGVIRRMQHQGPYNFCGYSLGGLVAYEMAVLLQSEGESVGLLALLDAPNPTLISDRSSSTEFRKTYLFDRIKKYGRSLVQGKISTLIGYATRFIRPRAIALFWPLIGTAFRLIKRPVPIELSKYNPAFARAWWAYSPNPYPQRLVLFRGDDRGPEYDRDLSMGWAAYAPAGLDVHTIPGGHVRMLEMPFVRELGERLNTYLSCSNAL